MIAAINRMVRQTPDKKVRGLTIVCADGRGDTCRWSLHDSGVGSLQMLCVAHGILYRCTDPNIAPEFLLDDPGPL